MIKITFDYSYMLLEVFLGLELGYFSMESPVIMLRSADPVAFCYFPIVDWHIGGVIHTINGHIEHSYIGCFLSEMLKYNGLAPLPGNINGVYLS